MSMAKVTFEYDENEDRSDKALSDVYDLLD